MRTDIMAKKMLIDATHVEETRVVVVDGNKVEEFDFETVNKRQLAGNIYLAKVTRVEPSLQAAFVDYGGNRHGFLAFSEIHPDYYQIPVADREALLAEERAYAKSLDDDEVEKKPTRRRRSRPAKAKDTDAVETREVTPADGIGGMDVVDLGSDDTEAMVEPIPVAEGGDAPVAEPVAETPEVVETPAETPEVAEPAADDVVADDPAETVEEAPAAETTPEAEASPEETPEAEAETSSDEDDQDDEPKRDATDRDDSIESVADEDVSEEIRQPRKPRTRRYKIQEVVKVRQILLVQVVKEERGNKGAALTTYLSLAGRYCVLMPNTARGGGISRKITNAPDRKKLKEIANEIDVPEGAGLIIRTAGAKRTKTEIKRDYEYLQRLWEQIRELTLKSIAPAPIYEEGDLIKRSIRDLYNREIDEVLVEGDGGYRIAKDFMKMIMPSHAKNVKQYHDALPLFARHQVESYLSGMFNPVVQLRSGGYIVIGITEALVAIDVNSGRATKEGSIEDTALKTNLEAAEEVARQLRLRDLAGLIVIDFIDMEERRNNASVEKRFKDKLKTDRARIQVGRISGFGLMEMSRQRLRPGMLEASTQPCPSCHGTGLLRSDDSLGLSILRQLEEEGTRRKSREVLVKAPISICNFLMNQKREHVAQIEARYGLSVRIEADPHMISPDFTIEKFKTATRVVEATAPVISIDTSDMPDEEEIEAMEAAVEPEVEEVTSEEEQPKKRRRRRRRRRGGSNSGEGDNATEGNATDDATTEGSDDAAEPVTEVTEDAPKGAEPAAEPAAEEAPKEKKRTRTRRRKKPVEAEVEAPSEATEAATPEETPAVEVEAAPAQDAVPVEDTPVVEVLSEETATAEVAAEPEPVAEVPAEAEAPAPVVDETPEPVVEDPASDPEPEPVLETVEAVVAESEPAAPPKPKRRGWWSKG
jgi:ribonuclease E